MEEALNILRRKANDTTVRLEGARICERAAKYLQDQEDAAQHEKLIACATAA